MFEHDEVIAVTGELVVLSENELAAYIAKIGHLLVSPESNAFSILVVACQPNGAAIAKAKSVDATILIERQFLDRLPTPVLIERARSEACDPTTSKMRLTELASVVPEAILQNPLWQVLHLEDTNFLDYEDELLKLRLLRLMPDELFDELAESISASTIGVDVFAISGVAHDESDSEGLSHTISISGFNITIFCRGGDTILEDVGLGCEDRLPIGEAINAYLKRPFADLQHIADQCGVSYEEQMSPCDGTPFHVGGFSIESKDELMNYEWDSLPDDKNLIARLVEAGDNVYRGVSLVDVGQMRPLFGCPPVVTEDYSTEGWIKFQWACDCYIPIIEAGDADTAWVRLFIDQEWTLYGSDPDTYSVEYEYSWPIELEGQLAVDIDANKDVSRKIGSFLARMLCCVNLGQPK